MRRIFFLKKLLNLFLVLRLPQKEKYSKSTIKVWVSIFFYSQKFQSIFFLKKLAHAYFKRPYFSKFFGGKIGLNLHSVSPHNILDEELKKVHRYFFNSKIENKALTFNKSKCLQQNPCEKKSFLTEK